MDVVAPQYFVVAAERIVRLSEDYSLPLLLPPMSPIKVAEPAVCLHTHPVPLAVVVPY